MRFRLPQIPFFMGGRIPVLGWYFFWLGIILSIYWPGIIILPKRDHTVFMMGRQLAENDLDWFLSVLSYNRTRLLQPGDYIAFRPVHMAVLALVDILARNRFIVQGVICCSILANAATMFFFVSRRLIGPLAACALTLLWFTQLAGVEIVLWQHINPYLLAPAGLMAALLIVTREEWSGRAAFLAGVAVLIACLTHEAAVMTALALAGLQFLDRHSSLRGRVFITFLPAALIALSLNAVDYLFIHPPHALIGPLDHLETGLAAIDRISELAPLVGAIGSAFFRPDSVHVGMTDEFSFYWNFLEAPPVALLVCGGFLLIIVVAACLSVARQSLKFGTSRATLIGLFFVLFFGAVAIVILFRVLTRDISYMFGAGYYFSLFSLSMCGMLAYLFSRTGKRTISWIALLMFGLAFWHLIVLRTELSETSGEKRKISAEFSAVRGILVEDRSVCFGGMDPLTVPWRFRCWAPLFSDLSCTNNPTAQPLYIEMTDGYKLARLPIQVPRVPFKNILPPESDILQNYRITSTVLNSPVIQFGYALEFNLSCAAPYSISLEPENEPPYRFEINYNGLMVDLKYLDSVLDNVLIWNATKSENLIKMQFTPDSILLFGNNQLLSVVRRNGTVTGRYCRVVIRSLREDVPVHLTRFVVATEPVPPVIQLNKYLQRITNDNNPAGGGKE